MCDTLPYAPEMSFLQMIWDGVMHSRDSLVELHLSNDDASSIECQVRQVRQTYSSTDDDFMQDAPVVAAELPRTLRSALNEFKMGERAGALVIHGLPIDEKSIGPTPGHWDEVQVRRPPGAPEAILLLAAQLLGDPIGWATQQSGRIVHDIEPSRGHEYEQLGSGSLADLFWHTEEAFHPYRADYIGLLCLRNPDTVATTFASLDGISLPPKQWAVLFEPRFLIRPDPSHLPEHQGAAQVAHDPQLVRRARGRAIRMEEAPEPVAVLFGDPRRPYLRIDPAFMQSSGDAEADEALAALAREISQHMDEVALQAGDLLFLDNYRVVHGRKSFTARFNGTDRWLKRVCITRDLRKSRAYRTDPRSHVIY
jgi:Fe(II)/alpha-ketoglutarate-dependent arginine beta-hydroxylase